MTPTKPPSQHPHHPHHPTHRPVYLRRVLISLISTLIVTGLVVVLLLMNAQGVMRWVYLNKLCDDDPIQYQRGVNYLVRHARGTDPDEPLKRDDPGRLATLAAVRERLKAADDRCFDATINALSLADAWHRRFDTALWMRYLHRRLEGADADARASIAVEFASILWGDPALASNPHAQKAIQQLGADDDATVRLNTLSAIANLPKPERAAALDALAADPEPVVAQRARTLRGLLEPAPAPDAISEPAPSSLPPENTDASLRELARLEALPIGQADIAITEDLPPLMRVYAVRAAAGSTPEDLIPVFDSESPSLRDLGVIVALERFDDASCAELAKTLIGAYEDSRRMSGAVLGGMCGVNDGALPQLMRRQLDPRVDWIVRQHFNLGLTIRGEVIDGFDPIALLAHDRFPRTTLVMGLMRLGRTEGLDWLLNPLGEAPVPLELLLDQLRYWPVLRRHLPEAPSFSLWADTGTQREQTQRLREWYLLRRGELRFDSDRKIFTLAKP